MSSTGLPLRSAVLYRTAEDVRAIPNEQWEEWVRDGDHVPYREFAASSECQMALKWCRKAAKARVMAKSRARSRGRS